MIMMRDDRYAVALADAYSRVTAGERIGVCTVQGGVNGAGLQYSYPGLAQAFEDNSPMLCITDGIPAGSTENTQFDVATSLKTVTKWFGYIDRPERVPEFMRRAFTMLRSGRPGPVVLAVPNAAAVFDETADPYTPVRAYKSGPDPADVNTAVDLLLGAKDPLIYAGEGVIYAGASAELKALAELVNAPVITTLKAKGAFPENHPLFVGVRGDHPAEFLTKSDVILAVGSSLSPGRFTHGIPDPANKTIIQCNLDEFHINRIYPTSHAVIGDARFTLRALADAVAERTGGSGRASDGVAVAVKAARDAGLAKYREVMASDDTPINPYRVFGDMMKALDPMNSFVTHDSGNTRDQLSTVYDTLIPRGFLGWGNISTLGFGLAGAMAAKIAFPERQCVAVTGDAGVGYMLGNLEVPVRQKIGITVAHISNGGFAGYGPWLLGRRPRSVHPQGDGSRRRGHVPCSNRVGSVRRAGEPSIRDNSCPPPGPRGQRLRPTGLYRVRLLPVSGLRRLGAQPRRALSGASTPFDLSQRIRDKIIFLPRWEDHKGGRTWQTSLPNNGAITPHR